MLPAGIFSALALAVIAVVATLPVPAQAETGVAPGLARAQLVPQVGHRAFVLSVAYSPDGDRVVAGDGAGSVRIWDARTGEETALLVGHAGSVNAVAYHPDGKRIASGGDDGTVRIWHAHTGAETAVLTGHADGVNAVVYSPDGAFIASGGSDGVRIRDAHSGAETAVLTGHADGVNAVVYSPDGAFIASGGSDGVRIRDAHSGEEVGGLRDGPRWVSSMAYSPDGSRIVTVSDEGTARIWNAHTGHEAGGLSDDARWVSSVAYSPDSKFVASGTDSGTVRIWDALTGKPEAELPRHPGDRHQRAVHSVAYSPDGGNIISGSYDGTVRIWDVDTGHSRITIAGAGLVNSVAYSPDGTRIASAAYEGWLRTWQVGRPNSAIVNPEMTYQSFPGRRWVAFRPGHLYYVANFGAERQVRIRFDSHRCRIFRFLRGAGSCPVYPLEWYRDVLRLDPQEPDLYAALQRQDPDIRPQALRMVWERMNWLPVVLSGLVLVMLGITIQVLRQRRDPLALMKEFFAAANDYDVQRRLTSHALLLGDRNAARHYTRS